ncbi:alpha/beta hydrolase family protein [Streptomyces luteocolor]|uniref:alpha/beta hydrolase family protein n=1 Tax=Streptomyces luteocolor TaxID=285500 RepID=UPI00099FB7C2|nr:alpha/beta hydrolase [Streptomyces luteocolor]
MHTRSHTRRTVTASALLGAAALWAGGGREALARGGGAGADAGLTLTLPAPTGPYPTGVTTLYLVDRSRRDPWTPGIPVRELMVTVFYPARDVRGRPVARQMTRAAARLFGAIDASVHRLPPSGVDWAATATHSHPDAPARAGRWPVLLYSPGGGDPRTLGTGLAEELASHGRVVLTVDHPGDTSEVEFPVPMRGRKRVRETVFRTDPRLDARQFRTMIDTRVADLRFVLDQVAEAAAGRPADAAGRPVPRWLGRALDPCRVGLYGHSAGGTAVALAMDEDRRVAAAVTMEGFLDEAPEAPGREGPLFPVARHGTDRPLLLLGTDGFPGRKDMERAWSAVLARSRGLARRVEVEDAAHWVFTDYAAMAPQLQEAGLMPAADRLALVGGVAPAVSVPAVRHHVRAFFARHLAG